MAEMNCSSDAVYLKGDLCCARCPAGKYVRADCEASSPTLCENCGHGFYTATTNHLKKCQPCSVCSSDNNQRPSKECTANKNTVCECETGFYCSNDQCDHCQPVTHCPPGEGVKVPPTRTSDTICAPCEKGTYSNVTDFLSACKPHTRCEDTGRDLRIPGTKTANAVCSGVLPRCSWMLPAGLWSGLVLTALVLFVVVICWRTKRKSYKPATSSVPAPVPLVEIIPTALVPPLDLPLPLTEVSSHCQESSTVMDCKIPLFHPENDLVCCDVDSSLPITPLKVSVSFAPNLHTGNFHTGNFHRTCSEPQEDEWCGT